MPSVPDPYLRQRALPGFGEHAQGLLTDARVVIVGVGGLGCPVAQYLVAAGVGRLTLIDADQVAVTDLHRQILFGPDDVGRPKAGVAAAVLHRLAPGVEVTPVRRRLTSADAAALLAGHDLVVDATDTLASRFAIADAAAGLGLPVVWGAVSGWHGQVTVFNDAVGLRDVFPDEPEEDLGTCEPSAVLGTLCGQVGTAMATAAVVRLTGIGHGLPGVMTVLDARTGRWREVPLAARGADAQR